MDKAVKADSMADYWLYRAEGVEHHANRKNDPRVRARRIKTLLAELRDMQRDINHAHLCLIAWEKITDDDAISRVIGSSIPTGALAPFGTYSKLHSGEITAQEARALAIECAQRTIGSDYRRRYIEHTLNRLSYERETLGSVARYEGELSPVILQAFAREHGAHKPKGRKSETGNFVIESTTALPLHLADDTALELSADEWRDLMQSVGYEVPQKKPAKPPILNLKTAELQTRNPYHKDRIETLPVVELTKAEYGKVYAEQRGTRLSLCGTFRFRVCPNPKFDGPRYMAGWCAVFISDQKAHPLPESLAASETAEAAE